MEPIENIKHYKRSFNRLSKNPENMFLDYLKTKKLTKLEFLYEVGLNKCIINELNFDEIEKLINEIIEDEKFPVISYPIDGENLEQDNLSVHTSGNNQDIVIGKNFIKFNLYNKSENSENITYITYLLKNNVIEKIEIILTLNKDESDSYVESTFIKAEQTEYELNGKVLSNNSYDVKINCLLNNTIRTAIYRDLTKESILPGIATILGLIETGKLNRSDLEINLNMNELLKNKSF